MFYELEIESNFERACSRVSGRSRAGVPVSFPIRLIIFARVGGGVRSLALPKERNRNRTFFPKTTVPWLVYKARLNK